MIIKNSPLMKVAALMIIGKILSVVSLLMFSGFLEAKEYGMYSLVASSVAVLSIIIQFGGQNYYLKEAARLIKEKKLKGMMGKSLVVSLVLAIIIYFSLDLGFLGSVTSWIPGSIIVVLALLLCWLNNFSSIARVSLGSAKAQIVESIIRYSVSIVVFWLFFISLGKGFEASIIGYSMSLLVPVAVFGVFLIPEFRKVEKQKSESGFFLAAFPIYFLSLARLLTGEATPLIISGMIDVESVGVFRFFSQLTAAASFFLIIINYYYSPLIARFFQDPRKSSDQKKEVKIASAVGAIVTGTIVVGLYFLMQSDFISIFPSHFSKEAGVFLIVGLGGVINVYFGPLGVYLVMAGKASLAGVSVVVAGIANAILLIMLTPYHELYGVAISVLASTIILNLMMMYFNKGLYQ